MRLALIPPKGLESFLLHSTGVQMALPAMHGDDKFSNAFEMAAMRDDLIMMDNGAAEGMTLPTTKGLCTLANEFGAQEVVLPDVLGNVAETQRLAARFLSEVGYLPSAYMDHLSFVGVAQGPWGLNTQRLIETYANHPKVKVIAIPRLLITAEHLAVRIDVAHWINNTFPGRFAIHLFGTNPMWVRELVSAARYAPFIRSADTSLPFNYAIGNEDLSKRNPMRISRVASYFTVNWSATINQSLLQTNIDTVLGWVNAEAPIS